MPGRRREWREASHRDNQRSGSWDSSSGGGEVTYASSEVDPGGRDTMCYHLREIRQPVHG